MIRSLSSLMMTKLIEWRNPKNERRTYEHFNKTKYWNMCKKMMSEPCFLIVSLAAMIESTVCGIFLTISIPFYFITIEQPFIFACQWLKSASFTYTWGSVLLVYNFIQSTLISAESRAFHY